MKDKITRRGFLKSAAMAAGLAASVPVLEACAQVAPTPVIVEKKVVETVLVEKPVAVEKKVVETVIVEKPVEKKVVETVLVEKPVEKKVVETVLVEKEKLVTPTPQYKDVTIEVYLRDAPDSPNYWVSSLANERFMKEFPGVKSKITTFGTPAEHDKLYLRMKTGDNPPEVATSGGSAQELAKINEYVKEGYLYDLTAAMDQPSYDTPGASWKETMLPAVLPYMTWEGRIIAVPREAQFLTIMYHKGVLDKLGIAVPKTWPEFIVACDLLKKNNIFPVAVSNDWHKKYWWLYLVHHILGTPAATEVFLSRKSAVEEPGMMEVAKLLEQVRDNYFQEGWEGTDGSGAWSLYITGKAAFLLEGMWMVGSEGVWPKELNPDDFRLMYFPAVPGGKGVWKSLFSWVNHMNATGKSDYPELGAEWLRIYTSVEFQTMRVQKTGIIPGWRGVPLASWGPWGSVADLFSNAEELFLGVLGTDFTAPKSATKINDAVDRFVLKETDAPAFLAELDEAFKGIPAELGM